jgi:hypothetical protein
VACDVGVDLVIDVDLEGGEETAHTVVVAVVAAAWDPSVDSEAEQGEAEVRDVVHVADDDLLASHLDGDGASACDADLAVVGEGDELVVDAVVVDESLVEGPEVVGGATVEDGHLAGGCA